MSVTVEQFKEEFPEFRDTENIVIRSRLNMSEKQINSAVWGTKRDDGIKLLTAHHLALSPLGEQAKLKKENRGTIYGDQFDDMMRQVASGFRVI